MAWTATDGLRQRGVVLTVPQMLRWSLRPQVTDERLPEAVARLARHKPELVSALTDADAFFADSADLEIVLPVEVNVWDPEESLD